LYRSTVWAQGGQQGVIDEGERTSSASSLGSKNPAPSTSNSRAADAQRAEKVARLVDKTNLSTAV
jgi:hypothetical protein